ncbi:MAG: uroporphyrinogen decarboxylase family protein [Candidatus Bathyarchaeia archaeon]
MNARERLTRYLHYREVDRPPFTQWQSIWPETVDRWRAEGLPPGVNPYEYFDFDKTQRRTDEVIPLDLGPIPRFITRTLYEDARYRVYVDGNGVVCKELKGHTSVPLYMDYPVKTPEDWERMKKRFDAGDMRRYPNNWGEELLEYYETVDHPVYLSLTGFYGQARRFMGAEGISVAFYKSPNMVHDMMDFWADFVLSVCKDAVKEAKIDYAVIWEDMAYKNGPHISPRLFKEFMTPNYRKITGFLNHHGIDIIMVDSDGNHDILTPLWLEVGVNCPYPLEVNAGMDAAAMRKTYGKALRLIGNIDKRALAQGPEAIDRELDRRLPLVEDGGYIPAVDHAVSADISFQNYCYYVKQLKQRLHVE